MGGVFSKKSNSQSNARAPPVEEVTSEAMIAKQVSRREQKAEAAPPSSIPEAADGELVQVRVIPHVHSKYCDRNRQVCTADGAVREGNALVGVAPVDGMVLGWYVLEDGSGMGMAPPSPAVGGGEAATNPPKLVFDENGEKWRIIPTPHPWTAAGLMSGVPSLPREEVERAADRFESGVSNLFGLAERNALTLSSADVVTADIEADLIPTFSPLGATALTLALSRGACKSGRLYLSSSLVGRRVRCFGFERGFLEEVEREGSEVRVQDLKEGETRVARSPICGPIESGTPKMREVWIQEDVAEHNRLIARSWYFGGIPGQATYRWLRINAEGEREEIAVRKGPAAGPPPRPGDLGARSEKEEEGDARVLVLLPEDKGAQFKVQIEPFRNDGVSGHPHTSRPTSEIP